MSSTASGKAQSEKQLRVRDHWDDRLVGLESVFLGERNLGQQTLEIVISGYFTLRTPKARYAARWKT
jgi:hypothetical protein